MVTFQRHLAIQVKDFGLSWRSGVAFHSVIHAIRPDLVDMELVQKRTNRENLEEAFSLAENELGIPRLLDPEGTMKFAVTKKVKSYLPALYTENTIFKQEPRISFSTSLDLWGPNQHTTYQFVLFPRIKDPGNAFSQRPPPNSHYQNSCVIDASKIYVTVTLYVILRPSGSIALQLR